MKESYFINQKLFKRIKRIGSDFNYLIKVRKFKQDIYGKSFPDILIGYCDERSSDHAHLIAEVKISVLPKKVSTKINISSLFHGSTNQIRELSILEKIGLNTCGLIYFSDVDYLLKLSVDDLFGIFEEGVGFSDAIYNGCGSAFSSGKSINFKYSGDDELWNFLFY